MIGAAFAGAGTVVLKIVVLKIKDDGVLTWLQRPAKEVLADDAALPAESLQIQEVVKEDRIDILKFAFPRSLPEVRSCAKEGETTLSAARTGFGASTRPSMPLVRAGHKPLTNPAFGSIHSLPFDRPFLPGPWPSSHRTLPATAGLLPVTRNRVAEHGTSTRRGG